MSQLSSRFTLSRLSAVLLYSGLLSANAFAANYAYIPNSGSNTLSVINTDTGVLATTVTPRQLDSTLNSTIFTATVRPGGSNELWFGQFSGSNKLGVIDTTNNTLKTVISGTGGATSITFSTDGATAFMTDYGSGKLAVVNAATKTLTGTYPVCSNPISSVIKSDNSMLYIRCTGGRSAAISPAPASLPRWPIPPRTAMDWPMTGPAAASCTSRPISVT